MTCREKLEIEHPDQISLTVPGGCRGCPEDYGYLDSTPIYCEFENAACTKCWDREIPEETTAVNTIDPEPAIKDSGDRTKFESGAVRDMRAGKGRCDLMPLEVVARMYEANDGHSTVFDHIVHFQHTNATHHLVKALFKFSTEAYRGNEREALCSMFLDVAKHYEEGALKYGPDNWRRGIPTWCYIDSAIRHYLKWLRGDNDEPHNRAFVWNLMCCIWEVDYREKGATE